MTEWMTDERSQALRAICDTIVPALQRTDDQDGFWARTASELGADQGIVAYLAGMPEDQRTGLLGLIDALAAQGIVAASPLSREELLRRTALLGPLTGAGVGVLISLTLFLTYGLPDPATGQNPMWRRFGFPGPIGAPQQGTKSLHITVPQPDSTIEADIVIVGSGAGGGVIAGQLAQAGLRAVVLEAGGYFDESDFNQLELWGFQNLYWRGGPTPTADFNISLQAGATLGGGTTVNWTNCLRTRPWVREQWAREHGLKDLDGPEFDRHLDAVAQRISVNEQCSDFNGPTKRFAAAAEHLGWSFATIARNTDPATYDPASAGYLGFGDQSGSKQGTMKTYLRDASDAGAQIIVRTRADRVLVDNGRAAGVSATYTDPATGDAATFTVRAPRVVVAGGALESPALLLRSGIGGPAVGKYLRLHPVAAVAGIYAEDQQAWWGAPHTGLIDEFADTGDGYGFLIETAQYTTGLGASAVPWASGAAHKQFLSRYRNAVTSLAVLRDRGHGQVSIDADGNSVVSYSITDELDLANLRRGVEALAIMHEAAGAVQIVAFAEGLPTWRWGEDLDPYIAAIRRIPFRAGGYRMFSAHQMGSCRMGTDPQTSVAGPTGELHDTPGVWIGDGSAFPTASGTNPMLSIMALAHRTAEAIAADAGATIRTGVTAK
ncbi:GMC family oxidoreductase N-terminal domain-containing protein [Nocardia sp. NBC_01388]|uniref:GMC family oxidoreductase N-terminal domain-containing protein n=1 Tax=Nocardia sp. NBC_01388 TaxID=2903596 RepID=UPI003253D9EC